MAKNSAEEILAAGRQIAKRAAPYFQAKLYAMVPRESPGLGTVGTTKSMIMSYDPEVVATWTADQMGGVWVHEILHVVLKCWARLGGRDPHTWNIAQDICINQMCRDMKLELPTKPAPCLPENFGFPPGLTSDQYYDLLVKLSEKNGASGDGSGDGDPKNGCCSGHCGGVAGNPGDNEPVEDDPDGRSEQEMARQDRTVAEAMRAHADGKGAGSIPSELLRWADVVIAPAKVPWQQKLAVICRRAIAYKSGSAQQRYDRPSRRQAGLGYGSGVPVLPALRTPVPKIAVAVDTSGSMGEEEGIRAVSEISGILKAVGASVTFCACDADVQSFVDVRSISEVLRNMKGGGGTVMDPMFRAVEKVHPSVLVIATDGGWFDRPLPPKNVHVIILLVGKHRCKPPIDWLDRCDVIELDD